MIYYFIYIFYKGEDSMKKSYVEIEKGVKFLCINSNKFKTNCIKVDFYLPMGEHLAAQNVLASLMGHTSRKYSSFKTFNGKIESLYGADFDTGIATIGEKVRIRFSMEIVDDRFSLDGSSIAEETVDFLIEIIKNPHCENEEFDKDATEREVRFTLQNIEAEKNDKRSYAVSRLRQLMCQGEPYGIDREKLENDVKNLDGKKLYAAYADMLKSSTIIITACGSLDGEMVKEKFSEFVNSIADRNPAELPTVFITKTDKIRYFKDEMDVNQAKLVIGLRSGMENADDDYFSFRVMTDIFGGGPYSRLFLNVREKMSLCYYCGARLLREKGIIFIQSGIEEENYEKALTEILKQLDVMKNGEFTDEDFNSSIIALSDAFKGVEDSPVAVCTFYSSQAFDDTLVSGQEYAEKISSVTRDQIVKCAKRVSVDSVYLLAGESGNNE